MTVLPRARLLGAGLKESCDPQVAVRGVRCECGDRAVAQLFATRTGTAQEPLAPRGDETYQQGDLR